MHWIMMKEGELSHIGLDGKADRRLEGRVAPPLFIVILVVGILCLADIEVRPVQELHELFVEVDWDVGLRRFLSPGGVE